MTTNKTFFPIGVSGASNSYIEGALDARRIHQMGFALGMASGLDFIVKERWRTGFLEGPTPIIPLLLSLRTIGAGTPRSQKPTMLRLGV